MSDKTIEQALFDKFGKDAFLGELRAFISRHPDMLVDALQALVEGVMLARARVLQSLTPGDD